MKLHNNQHIKKRFKDERAETAGYTSIISGILGFKAASDYLYAKLTRVYI